MMNFILATLFASLAVVHASQVCCPDVGCFSTTGVYKHLPSPSCVEKYGVKLALYTRNNRNSPKYLERTGSIPKEFSNRRRTVFLIHGYMNNMNSGYMTNIKNAMLSRSDINMFLVDWKSGANSPYYPNSASNTRPVGAEVAIRLDRLVKAGLSRSQTWCVGYSLGAHACGFAGMATKIQRITGLDPAGPWFDGYDAAARLNPRAATLVDVMHTDGGGKVPYYGLISPVGHMDFYPNRGYDQPGCKSSLMQINETGYFVNDDIDTSGDITDSCSHGRAVLFFEQSIQKGCFMARQICTDEKKLPSSCALCSGGTCGEMGYHADSYKRHGRFYLETRDRAPFCL